LTRKWFSIGEQAEARFQTRNAWKRASEILAACEMLATEDGFPFAHIRKAREHSNSSAGPNQKANRTPNSIRRAVSAATGCPTAPERLEPSDGDLGIGIGQKVVDDHGNR
jgi:hypothetical protein